MKPTTKTLAACSKLTMTYVDYLHDCVRGNADAAKEGKRLLDTCFPVDMRTDSDRLSDQQLDLLVELVGCYLWYRENERRAETKAHRYRVERINAILQSVKPIK